MDLEQFLDYLRSVLALGADATYDEMSEGIKAMADQAEGSETKNKTSSDDDDEEKEKEKSTESDEDDDEDEEKELTKALAKLLGTETGKETLAAAKGAAQAATRVAELSKRLADLEKAKLTMERDSFIAANPKKFTPALVQWAKGQSVAELRAWSKYAPDVSSAGSHIVTSPIKGSTEDLETERLKKVAQSKGIRPEFLLRRHAQFMGGKDR